VRTKPVAVTRLRSVWLGVKDIDTSRAFYERLGAHFEPEPGPEGVVYATLGGFRLNFEIAKMAAHPGGGYILLFDVTDADALHAELKDAGCTIEAAPHDTPWGRHFRVTDPDGYSIAFVGPKRA
jgi:predicted enzyme related to lactoylglutathione lyase